MSSNALGYMRRLPPQLVFIIFYSVMPVALLIRFLTSTIAGVFLTSICLYVFMDNFSASKPFGPAELARWVDELPSSGTIAVMTMMLTVIGFLAAFHTTTESWKAQRFADLKTKIADEIEEFYNEAGRRTVDAKIYINTLIRIAEDFKAHGIGEKITFDVNYALSGKEAFLAVRNRLVEMSISVHRIRGRHALVLGAIGGALDGLDESADAFNQITNSMWVDLPFVRVDSPEVVRQFVSQIPLEKCYLFIRKWEENYDRMNGLVGAIRGTLLSHIVAPTFIQLQNLLREPKQVRVLVELLRAQK